ncbi:MAG: hypothetical protein CMP07_11980 [Xanthomonadales bacterium]|nr:hypothetical protein [Xanthomonadales bacterium]|tara:strand:+ start:1936 stop:2343 length:408 start_codon:yes stop_codon:yes gene_type:complete
METFSEIAEFAREHFNAVHDEKFVLGLEIPTGREGRHQSVFLAEVKDDNDRRYLHLETTLGPLGQHDPLKVLRINLMLRVGYLAVGDLESVPFLKLCQNIDYRYLGQELLLETVRQLAEMGDEMEQTLTHGGDWF